MIFSVGGIVPTICYVAGTTPATQSAGAYFVTIIAWQREMLFGDIVNGETPQGGGVILNEFGKIVRDEWERTAIVRPNVELGEYIIMPNHDHHRQTPSQSLPLPRPRGP